MHCSWDLSWVPENGPFWLVWPACKSVCERIAPGGKGLKMNWALRAVPFSQGMNVCSVYCCWHMLNVPIPSSVPAWLGHYRLIHDPSFAAPLCKKTRRGAFIAKTLGLYLEYLCTVFSEHVGTESNWIRWNSSPFSCLCEETHACDYVLCTPFCLVKMTEGRWELVP